MAAAKEYDSGAVGQLRFFQKVPTWNRNPVVSTALEEKVASSVTCITCREGGRRGRGGRRGNRTGRVAGEKRRGRGGGWERMKGREYHK